MSLKLEAHRDVRRPTPPTAPRMPQPPRASFWAAGPGPDRDPPARRQRPLLRQRGRRLRAPLAGRQGPARPTPSATSSRARASTPAGTTRTAAAASSATSPIEPAGRERIKTETSTPEDDPGCGTSLRRCSVYDYQVSARICAGRDPSAVWTRDIPRCPKSPRPRSDAMAPSMVLAAGIRPLRRPGPGVVQGRGAEAGPAVVVAPEIEGV